MKKILALLVSLMTVAHALPCFAEEAENVTAAEQFYTGEIKMAVNGGLVNLSQSAIKVSEGVLVPFRETAEALELTYSFRNGEDSASSPVASVSYNPSTNEFYIKKLSSDRVLCSFTTGAEYISGMLFVPISLFEQAYDLTMIMDEYGEKPTLYIATAPVPEYIPNNSYVNSAGLSSATDYLVWISKSEYKVRVYLGSRGSWEEIKAFTCGIGAPKTPTCEGTFKYYQAQSKWDYKTYYVGPVMRFNGGYAIHSTLLYPNGTPMDNRVGIKLSHGCVRLRPDDINWMFYYIPLQTTIHITA